LVKKNEAFKINVLVGVAIVGQLLFTGGAWGTIGAVVLPVSTTCGLASIYFLIKKRKELTKNQKYIGWGLLILWVIILGITGQTQA
jgi:FtsH-binding integral membrane protein